MMNCEILSPILAFSMVYICAKIAPSELKLRLIAKSILMAISIMAPIYVIVYFVLCDSKSFASSALIGIEMALVGVLSFSILKHIFFNDEK